MKLLPKYGTVIAIDPDIGKNGIAVIDRESRACEVYNLNFPETLEKVQELHNARPKPFDLLVEAGWLNKGNWHVTESRNGKWSPSAYAAAVGKGEGECHAVSKKLIECFEHYGIACTPVKPLRKCWKGKDRKITHAELVNEMKLYRVSFPYGRTNQETRDAALICLVNL